MSETRTIELDEDMGLIVSTAGHRNGEFHCAVVLIVPESSRVFMLYGFVYSEPFRVKMFQLEAEEKSLEAEEEAFFEEVDRLHESKSEDRGRWEATNFQ